MIKNIFIFIASTLIAGTVVVLSYLLIIPKKIQILKPFSPETFFSIENAPSQSITGEVASISGNIAWKSRTANFAVPIDSAIKLQQGEEIEAQNNGKANITFPNTVEITVFSNTQINFIQSLRANFVIEQKQGIVEYKKIGDIPISIRALDILINIEKGTCNISLDNDTSDIIIRVSSGSATAAFNNTSNNTSIITINEGKQYLINNNTKIGKIKLIPRTII